MFYRQQVETKLNSVCMCVWCGTCGVCGVRGVRVCVRVFFDGAFLG